MAETTNIGIYDKKSGAGFKRNLLGHLLASVLVSTFLFVLSVWVFQMDFWPYYYFHDAQSLAADCQVSIAVTATRDRPTQFDETKHLEVPHFGAPLFKDVPPGKFAHAVYDCATDIAKLRSRNAGVVNIHVGWVYGDWVAISINGSERAAHPGVDKSVVPLNGSDLSQDRLNLTIWAVDDTATVGLLGRAPLVLADGLRKNNKIFGIETALQQERSLFTLLPILTLSMILIFGWIAGIRSRLMVTTLFYFMIMAGRHLMLFVEDVAPWSPTKTYPLSIAFGAGTFLAYSVFGMELMGLGRRYISRCMLGCLLIVAVQVGLALGLEDNTTSILFEKVNYGLLLASSITLLIFGIRKAKVTSEDPTRAKVHKIFLISTGVFIALSLIDSVMDRFGFPVRFSNKMDLAMPLFVGGVLLYTLALIERNLRVEREQRVKMEGDLAIAAKLQGIIIPSESEGRTHAWSYGIESKPFGPLSGDWVKVHTGEERSLFVLGDVVGKGPSAALTHSGIAAIWDTQIKQWERGAITAGDVLSAINTTMFGLFKGAMNTTFAAAEVGKDGSASVTACGNYWLHLAKDKCRLISPSSRALLGIKPDLTVSFVEVAMAPGDWLVCFTDGVLEGNRPIKRFFAAVDGKVEGMTAADIRTQLQKAGAESVQPDDASSLILRYEKPAQAAA